MSAPVVQDSGRRELTSLTSLRGLAAMAVVLTHFSATAQLACRSTIPSLVPHGYVGVDFFFVLSGFIMAYTYADAFVRDGFAAWPPFMAKRIARIVPLNVAVLAALALAGVLSTALLGRNFVWHTATPIRDFAANLLMLQGLGIGRNLNGPSWSISTEFAAYACFPLLAACVFGRRATAWSAVALSGAALCALAAARPRLGIGVEALPGSLVRCFAEFIIGMAAWRLYCRPRVADILGRDAMAAGFLAAACLGLVLRVDLAVVLVLPPLVIALAANDGRVACALRVRPLMFLGTISYSLYLLHNPFRAPELWLLQHASGGTVGPAAALLFAAGGAASIVPFAWLAYLTVERPGRTLLRQLLVHRRTLEKIQ